MVKWNKTEFGRYRCSGCNFEVTNNTFKHCPECGKKVMFVTHKELRDMAEQKIRNTFHSNTVLSTVVENHQNYDIFVKTSNDMIYELSYGGDMSIKRSCIAGDIAYLAMKFAYIFAGYEKYSFKEDIPKDVTNTQFLVCSENGWSDEMLNYFTEIAIEHYSDYTEEIEPNNFEGEIYEALSDILWEHLQTDGYIYDIYDTND